MGLVSDRKTTLHGRTILFGDEEGRTAKGFRARKHHRSARGSRESVGDGGLQNHRVSRQHVSPPDERQGRKALRIRCFRRGANVAMALEVGEAS